MDPKERLAFIRDTSNAVSTLQIRTVQGGYVVAASINYSDKITGGVLAAVDQEGIALNPEQAGDMVKNFLICGMFTPPPAPLLEQAGISVPVTLPPTAVAPLGAIHSQQAPAAVEAVPPSLDIGDERRDNYPGTTGLI